MNERFFNFLDQYSRFMRSCSSVVVWGGALFMLLLAILTSQSTGQFITWLVVGTVSSVWAWFSLRSVNKQADEAGEKLRAYAAGHKEVLLPSKQAKISFIAIFLIAIVAWGLLISCGVRTCTNETARPQLMFILIVSSALVAQLFYRERVKGKAAVAAAAVLLAGVVYLIARVLLQ